MSTLYSTLLKMTMNNNKKNKKSTLIVMSHFDDETFLMGGYLEKYFGQDNPNEQAIILTICGYGRGKNIAKNGAIRLAQCKRNANELRNVRCYCLDFQDLTLNNSDIPFIADNVTKLLKTFNPEKVFIMSEGDDHQDHVLTSKGCKVALHNPERYGIQEIYECPAPYSGLYHNNTPVCNTSLRLSDKVMRAKIRRSERYSCTENIPKSVYSPYEYFNLIWKRF